MIFIQKWGSNDIHLVNLVSGHIVKDVLNLGHGFVYYKNINIGHICHYPIISCDTLVNTLTFFEFSYAYYIDLCLILLVADYLVLSYQLPLYSCQHTDILRIFTCLLHRLISHPPSCRKPLQTKTITITT